VLPLLYSEFSCLAQLESACLLVGALLLLCRSRSAIEPGILRVGWRRSRCRRCYRCRCCRCSICFGSLMFGAVFLAVLLHSILRDHLRICLCLCLGSNGRVVLVLDLSLLSRFTGFHCRVQFGLVVVGVVIVAAA